MTTKPQNTSSILFHSLTQLTYPTTPMTAGFQKIYLIPNRIAYDVKRDILWFKAGKQLCQLENENGEALGTCVVLYLPCTKQAMMS